MSQWPGWRCSDRNRLFWPVYSRPGLPCIAHRPRFLSGHCSGRRPLVSFDGRWIILLLLPRRADIHLRGRPQFAVRPVTDNVLKHLRRLVHRGEEGDVTEQFKPLAVQEADGDGELAALHLVRVGRLGIFIQHGLVGVEGLFVLFFGLVTTAYEILGLRRIIGQGPDLDDALGRFQGQFVLFFIESLLGDGQLVFGPLLAPIALCAGRFVSPAFPRQDRPAGPVTDKETGTTPAKPGRHAQTTDSCPNRSANRVAKSRRVKWSRMAKI